MSGTLDHETRDSQIIVHFATALIEFPFFFLDIPYCWVVLKPPSNAFGCVENLRTFFMLVGSLGNKAPLPISQVGEYGNDIATEKA